MRSLKYLGLLTALSCLFAFTPSRSQAQVSFSLNVGPAPVCPYGYYAYAPYNCAPYGYYGPTWFSNGLFIGAGPWFHGPARFHGWVNRRYDPRFGYHGEFPHHGDHPDWGHHRDFHHHFHGNYQYDGHGHAYGHHDDHGHPH